MTVPPVKSPWGGFDVFVIPDDDDAARAAGWSDLVLALTSDDEMARDGDKIYVRKTTWQRLLAEFATLGAMH